MELRLLTSLAVVAVVSTTACGPNADAPESPDEQGSVSAAVVSCLDGLRISSLQFVRSTNEIQGVYVNVRNTASTACLDDGTVTVKKSGTADKKLTIPWMQYPPGVTLPVYIDFPGSNQAQLSATACLGGNIPCKTATALVQ